MICARASSPSPLRGLALSSPCQGYEAIPVDPRTFIIFLVATEAFASRNNNVPYTIMGFDNRKKKLRTSSVIHIRPMEVDHLIDAERIGPQGSIVLVHSFRQNTDHQSPELISTQPLDP